MYRQIFWVEAKKANQAIAEYVPGNMRSQVIHKGTNTIILDAYNANPSSMQAAIESLAGMQAKKKVAIVGDMFELEEDAEKEHRALGKLLKEKKLDTVYLCGKLISAAKEEIQSAHYFKSTELLIDELKKNPIMNSTVLVKASRGMGLEAMIDFL